MLLRERARVSAWPPNGEAVFVRWHGAQLLLLTAMRTAHAAHAAHAVRDNRRCTPWPLVTAGAALAEACPAEHVHALTMAAAPPGDHAPPPPGQSEWAAA